MKSRSDVAAAKPGMDAGRLEQEFPDHLRFEGLLAELSVGFVGVPGEEIDAAIRHALERIASVLDSDVGVVMEVVGEQPRVRTTHAYRRPGIPMDLPEFPEVDFPWLAGRLFRGEVTRLARLEDLPAEAVDDRRSIEGRGVQSVVICPILADGTVTGAVAFAGVGRERQWPDELVDRLCLVGQLFAGALARRRLEERLAEERQFAAAVIESLPGVLFMLDERGHLVRWNRNHETVFGYSGAELRGLHFSTYGAPEERDQVQAEFERVLRDGAASTELHVIAKGGGRIPQFASARSAIMGGRRYVVGMAIDLSPLKAAEEQVRRQQAELAHVARVSAMGELAAAIAHELNQPLTAIHTNSQATRRMLARGGVEPAELDEALVDITADAVRAGEIIRRLRDLLRKGDAERLPLDVNELIRSVEPFARLDVLEHNAGLVMKLASGLPPVAGDHIQLQQVVLNLIRNASEATRDTDVERRELVVSTAFGGPGTIEVTVSDRGPPLSDEDFARMFQPFYTTKPGGLGIGLSLSRSIVEAHGGLLWATRNVLESGITMHFTLPIEQTGGR